MIRKPPLVKAQTAFKKHTKNKTWRKTIFNMADEIFTPCNVARLWHWFHQVTAPCNVICGSGMTRHWICRVAAPLSVTVIRSSGIMALICQVAAPYSMAGGSGMTCDWIRPNVCHIGILHLDLISTISPQSTCHSAPVSEILSKSDHPRQKKMTPSWILGVP